MSMPWKTVLYNGGSLITEMALKILQPNYFRNKSKHSDTAINEILLYGSENEERMKRIGLNNLICIHYVILHASRSVDVCVPSLVSDSLANCLINVHKKNNVKVRITIHDSDNFHNLHLFARNDIEVKVIKTGVRLAHEFVLVDASDGCSDAVALMGSLDYETTRVNCNRDVTVLTSEPAVVTTLKREFDRVWYFVSDTFPKKHDKNSV